MITGIKTILLAGELEGRGYASIRQAHEWATTVDARLVVCALLPRRDQLSFRAGLGGEHLRARLMIQASAVADRVAAVTGRSLDDFDVQVASGPWHKAIPETAAAIGADLVVMSARGDDIITPTLGMGTIERVIQRTTCPVLLAHPSPSNGAVLAATDLSDPALSVLRRGADYARLRAGALTALHWLQARSWFPASLRRPSHASAAREQAHQALERALCSAQIQAWPKVADDAAATSIVHEAERILAELVVVGTPGGSGLIRPRGARVAEEVARRAPCSVLVVRTRPGHAAAPA